jgi:hypothetical protein
MRVSKIDRNFNKQNSMLANFGDPEVLNLIMYSKNDNIIL